MEFISVTAPSITIVLAWTIRASRSIQIGTPAAAKSGMSLARSQAVVLSAISRKSTVRSLARSRELDEEPSPGKPASPTVSGVFLSASLLQ
jgi:hypothetical protein